MDSMSYDISLDTCMFFPMAQMVKNLPTMQDTWLRSLTREGPLEKGTASHSRILPGEFHGQRRLAGCRPCGPKELDMTEQLTHTLCLSYYKWDPIRQRLCWSLFFSTSPFSSP